MPIVEPCNILMVFNIRERWYKSTVLSMLLWLTRRIMNNCGDILFAHRVAFLTIKPHFFTLPATPTDLVCINKESVEPTFVYQVGGCGMTLTEINDAIPHTWIVWGRCAERTHPHSYTRKSVVRRPSVLKLPHFLLRTIRKHFRKNVSLYANISINLYKVKKCFSFEQHFLGYRIINKSKMLRYTILYQKDICINLRYIPHNI